MSHMNLENVCSIITEAGNIMWIWRRCVVLSQRLAIRMLIWRGCVVLLQRLGM